MSTPAPLNSRTAEQLARAWQANAHKFDQFMDHARRELRLIDGYPAGGEGGNGENTPTEAAALARYNITSNREQIRDDLATIIELSNSLFRVLDIGLRTRAPSKATAEPCAAKGCQAWAVPHALASGAMIKDWCDYCWADRCQVCGGPGDTRRVEGRRACGTCYRTDLRSRIKEVA